VEPNSEIFLRSKVVNWNSAAVCKKAGPLTLIPTMWAQFWEIDFSFSWHVVIDFSLLTKLRKIIL
jgi:hypothetical protein